MLLARNPAMKARGAGTASAFMRISIRAVIAATFTSAALVTSMAMAAQTGGQISAGTGAISQTGASTTITQQSQNLAINWNSFSIAPNESVRFIQPNASSIALNRILGTDPSQILGQLSANGQVFILNPNGVLFGKGSQVNVGGLVASTLSLSNADFMAGNYRFSKDGTAGNIVNQGTLTAANGGYIALLAPGVRNEGVITATLGSALLAAGDKVTLNLDNGSLLGYSIDQGALAALAENRQLIQADGGQVIMSAKAVDALSMAVVNNTGIIEAHTVQNVAGVIKLMGDMQSGQVNVGGTLDTSAPNGGNGGFIETSAAHVNVANEAKITTLATQGVSGTWLIDPVDFTIAATGGDISGTTLGTNLGSGNVTILSSNGTTGTAGDVNVNDVVTWSANKLTLNAQNNININADLNGSGSAQLALEYGQSAVAAGNTSSYVIAPGVRVNLPAGGNFSTKLGSDGGVTNYTVITNLGIAADATAAPATTTLQGMAATANLAGNYVLGSDIDASATSTWNAGAGFAPVGDNSTGTAASQFTGIFDGLGHTISSLVINRPTTSNIGLFGYTAPASIVRNIGLVGGSVIGSSEVGGLVGYNSGSISSSYNTGSVSGINNVVGGLAGYNSSGGKVSNSYATGSVSGSTYVGGLVGANYGAISSDHAAGSVSGGTNVGGLVGYNVAGTISNSYATGSVSGNNAGGLTGQNYTGSTISNSYATGSVSGSSFIGGLVGINNGTIGNSYATGSVNGSVYVGGLVGYNTNFINTSFAAGSVSGAAPNVGGLIGYNASTGFITISYWDTQATGQASGIGAGSNMFGVTGLTTAQMRTMTSFAGWNIANTGGAGKIWRIYDGYTYPMLTSFLDPLTVTANDNGKVLNDVEPNLYMTGVSYSGFVNGETSAVLGGTLALARDPGETAGPYAINASGLASNNYDITYAPGVFTISVVGELLIVMANSSAIYGVDPATLTFAAPVYASYTDGITITDLLVGAFNSGNVWTLGDGITSYTAGTNYTLGANVGNYVIDTGGLTYTPNPNITSITTTPGVLLITPRPVALVAPSTPTKVYDGTTALAMTSGMIGISNIVGSDVVSITGSGGTYAVPNAGTGIGYTLNNLALTGAAAGNYILGTSSLNGTDGIITPAALTATANADSKFFDGLPYAGGNGVVYAGFVNGETSAVLGGTLVYGGTSQGAIDPGTYQITPGGLTSGNYTISYVDGPLTIDPANPVGDTALLLAYDSAQQSVYNIGTRDNDKPIKHTDEHINIVDCGVLMPPDAPANACQN